MKCNKYLLLCLVLFAAAPLYPQRAIDLRDYFFPQNQQTRTLQYGRENDTSVIRTSLIKLLGRDTIEVADHDKDNHLISSLTFVVEEKSIRVIAGRQRINKGVFDSQISKTNNVWLQTHTRSSKKVQLDIRTYDTCSSQPSGCYWTWERLKQIRLKKGHTHLNGKKYRTLSVTFEYLSLSQPTFFSSTAGLATDKITYVFAEGTGLIKRTIKLSGFKTSSVLVLLVK